MGVEVAMPAAFARKARIVGMPRTLARDLLPVGIRVNAIAPGTFARPPMLGAPTRSR
jgi:NAD(P)-dependent dehydrogenase (short-subunit alcohol dehydrogenase family)